MSSSFFWVFFSIYTINILLGDAVSKYCRTYKQETNGREFDFAGPSSLVSSNYFPRNVAFGESIDENPLFYVKTEVVDNDYCCQGKLNNRAFSCGILYPSTTLSTTTVTLNRPAFVNQIVTTWADPCK